MNKNSKLNRTLVSFQANKKEPFYRWFKYKEGFSKNLVNYFLDKYADKIGHILDPFAGAGATLFAAGERGWKTTGIELLPVGIYSITARLASEKTDLTKFKKKLKSFGLIFKNSKNLILLLIIYQSLEEHFQKTMKNRLTNI